MRKIELLAPAKINLFLKIINKRQDGFHNIETVFEKISLFDKLIIKDAPQNKIIIESNIKEIFSNRENTVYKAISLIKKEFKIKRGIYVYIEKSIPIAAGLAGGSSDAAATLKGLNPLWGLNLNQCELLKLASKIGSDVALFIPKTSFLLGKGRGEQLDNIPGAKNIRLWHILISPQIKISTAYAYFLFDKYYLKKKTTVKNEGKLKLTMPNYSAKIIPYALLSRDVSLLNYYSYNSFESVIFRNYPNLAKLKSAIEYATEEFVHLSGSGPTLFMTFINGKEAKKGLEKINRAVKGVSCFLVSTF